MTQAISWRPPKLWGHLLSFHRNQIVKCCVNMTVPVSPGLKQQKSSEHSGLKQERIQQSADSGSQPQHQSDPASPEGTSNTASSFSSEGGSPIRASSLPAHQERIRSDLPARLATASQRGSDWVMPGMAASLPFPTGTGHEVRSVGPRRPCQRR